MCYRTRGIQETKAVDSVCQWGSYLETRSVCTTTAQTKQLVVCPMVYPMGGLTHTILWGDELGIRRTLLTLFIIAMPRSGRMAKEQVSPISNYERMDGR